MNATSGAQSKPIALVRDWMTPSLFSAVAFPVFAFGMYNLHAPSLDLRQKAACCLMAALATLLINLPASILRMLDRSPQILLGQNALIIPSSTGDFLEVDWSQAESAQIVPGRQPRLAVTLSENMSRKVDEFLGESRHRMKLGGRLRRLPGTTRLDIAFKDLDVKQSWLLNEVQSQIATRRSKIGTHEGMAEAQIESLRQLADGERVIGDQWQIRS